MKKLALFVLLAFTIAFAGASAEDCAICSGDSVCDTCLGTGYQIVPLFRSDETVKIACTGGCLNGACPICPPVCALCGGDRICDTCFGMGYTLMTLYGSNEPIQIACTAQCNIGVCTQCVVECDTCENTGLCKECLGLGYVTMQIYGTDMDVQTACMGEACMQGFCSICMPETEDRFAAATEPAPTSAPTPAPTLQPTPNPQPTRTPKPTPTPAPVGQAVFNNGIQIADLSLYSAGEFHLSSKSTAQEYDFYCFVPTSSFEGYLEDFAEEYVEALIDSGYYRLIEINDSVKNFFRNYWYLEYIGPEDIQDAENAEIFVHGSGLTVYADVRITTSEKYNNITIDLNPDITLFK